MNDLKILDFNGKSKSVAKPRREITIEDLQKEFDRQLEKIELIKDFMLLFGQRNEIRSNLSDLRVKTIELKTFLKEARHSIDTFKNVEVPETNLLISKMREQHLKMLQMLANVNSTTNFSENDNRSDTSSRVQSNYTTPSTGHRILSKFNTITPKLHQSPFKIRGDPRMLRQLNSNFEANIKPEEFDKIPKYLKGRDMLDDVSTFLHNVIIKCFLDKYTLLHRDREDVAPHQMQRWRMYRSQMEYFPSEMFITEGDIAMLIGRMMDKKMTQRIAMLRHLQILQEMRKGSATCYIWKGVK